MSNNSYDDKKGIIYKATSPSGKVYIGKTIQSFKRRIKEHRNVSKKLDTPFYKALRKYRNEMKWEILHDNVSVDSLSDLEKKEILDYNCIVPGGYNSTPGGEGYCGEEHPMFGRKHTLKTKSMMSESHSGVNHHFFGKNLSQEHKDKISEAIGNIFFVYKDDIRIGCYKNQNTCAKELGLSRPAISLCLYGKRKSHHGYTFKYE